MAAYASLLSLGHILDQRSVLDKARIDSLLENISFLQDFLEELSLTRGDEIHALEEKIIRSACSAVNIIESRAVDQVVEDSEAGTERNSSTIFCQDLQKVREEFTSIKKDVMKIKETEGIKILLQPKEDATAGSTVGGASSSKNNTMVGFNKGLNQIMETLTGDEANLQILSLVGMGGIGKTTLAKNVFNNPLIERHFDLHAWVTISQEYSVCEILSGLLINTGVLEGEGDEITEDAELGLCLHRSLFGRRYFIVMDDMWSIDVWERIKRFFPDNNNGSRVMVTTRLTNVANDFHSCAPHQLHLLDEDQSWVLFCDKVFGKETCPSELVQVGKTIVRNCKGLPLAIVAISGLLAKSSRTIEYWEYVAEHTFAELDIGGDELCMEILSLSYKHLPVHLKPCFLYLAIFPEDHKIRISRLVKLWVGEGILKPRRCRSLEEVAEDNLRDLVDRNLITIHEYGSRNQIKTCTIHDLLRDLCLREARKEKFHRVTMKHSFSRRMHALINKRSSCKEGLKSKFAKQHRVAKVLKVGYICSDEELVRLVNCRYIDFKGGQMFENLLNTLESLSLLWNLQTVTITITGVRPINLPAEIWEMPQLRHLKMGEGDFYLPDPPPSTNRENSSGDITVLNNLQTLYKIRNFRCTEEVVHRIPNLKKLGITYNRESPSGFGWDYFEVYNLAHFVNLESLLLESDNKSNLENVCFPSSLKKLTLERCGLSWDDLTMVGSLPHLEVLTLRDGAVMGREWNPVEGQFLELKYLRIESSNLEEWIADSSHFPSLEKLQLENLKRLKEIPQGIGEIPTLGSILLQGCNDSANSSSIKIQDDQKSLGNSDLQVVVKMPDGYTWMRPSRRLKRIL